LPRRRFRRKLATAGVVFSSKKQPRAPQAPITQKKEPLALRKARGLNFPTEPCTRRNGTLYFQGGTLCATLLLPASCRASGQVNRTCVRRSANHCPIYFEFLSSIVGLNQADITN
jgi:hypothetical protein